MWDPDDTGEFWWQRGSFVSKVPIPVAAPCDPPTVCMSVNVEWLPYVLGALQQLTQPSTWASTDPAAILDVCNRAVDLVDAIGTAVPCNQAPFVPPGHTTAQAACNIAGYLANMIIREGLQKAVDAINQGQTIIGYGLTILKFIPGGAGVFYFLMQALSAVYNQVSTGPLTDYQDALNDPSLFGKITCAIYGAISAQGSVTSANYANVLTAVGAVSYVHADVISTIVGFLTDLGLSGVQQLQQGGALADYDCSGCPGGSATGPAGLPPSQAAGTISLTIPAGAGHATGAVLFTTPFDGTPIVTVSSVDPDWITSFSGLTLTGFTAEVAAPIDLAATLSVDVDWIAVLRGQL